MSGRPSAVCPADVLGVAVRALTRPPLRLVYLAVRPFRHRVSGLHSRLSRSGFPMSVNELIEICEVEPQAAAVRYENPRHRASAHPVSERVVGHAEISGRRFSVEQSGTGHLPSHHYPGCLRTTGRLERAARRSSCPRAAGTAGGCLRARGCPPQRPSWSYRARCQNDPSPVGRRSGRFSLAIQATPPEVTKCPSWQPAAHAHASLPHGHVPGHTPTRPAAGASWRPGCTTPSPPVRPPRRTRERPASGRM